MSTLRTSLIVIAMLALPMHTFALPPNTGPGGPRVRPDDSRSAAIVLEGMERSTTLRALIDALEARDVIIYIQMQPLLKGRLAGSVTWVTAAGRFRYIRVSWSPELSTSAAIATLGHELQHALEIASEPSIVSPETLEAFYRSNGINMRAHNGWDTIAARARGDVVRKEIASVRSQRATTDVLQDYSPESWPAIYTQARSGY